ncbi:hypothetical protein D3C86_2108260 [compost metagenome]
MLEGLAGLVLGSHRALGLDDHQGDAVDVDHHVRDAGGLGLNVELVRDGEGVVGRVQEVDEVDGLLGGLTGHGAAVVAP